MSYEPIYYIINRLILIFILGVVIHVHMSCQLMSIWLYMPILTWYVY